jgi:predicted DNA-binding transcriptional regulator AlpA
MSEYLSMKALAARLNMAESTGWARVAAGQLPNPTIRIGKRCSRWKWSDVEEHLDRFTTGSRKVSDPSVKAGGSS